MIDRDVVIFWAVVTLITVAGAVGLFFLFLWLTGDDDPGFLAAMVFMALMLYSAGRTR